MKRAVLYLRVSTDKQDLSNQLPALQQLAATRGLEIVKIYEETISGAKKKRPVYDQMMVDAKRGEFDYLLVWALDRLGRVMMTILEAVIGLDRIGVKTISYIDTWLDLEGPIRNVMIAFMGFVAENERARLIDRTNAGLTRARREGKTLGRPEVKVDIDHALRLRKEGLSVKAAAKKLGIGTGTLHRALQSSDVPLSARVGVSR